MSPQNPAAGETGTIFGGSKIDEIVTTLRLVL